MPDTAAPDLRRPTFRDPAARRSGLPPLLSVDPRRFSLTEGVRAGFAIASVVALGEVVHWPWLLIAALGAMLTCLCDAGGPVSRRLPALFTFALVGTVIMTGFSMLRAVPLVALPAAIATVFLTSFARAYGQSAMQVGNLLTVVLVLALRVPMAPPVAISVGLTFLGGALWAVLLTAALWRLHPYRPARAAVADVYRELAQMCGGIQRLLESSAHQEPLWDRLARERRRMVRDLVEQAREAVLSAAKARGTVAGRIAQGWIRLETVEQLFGALIALSELAQAAGPEQASRIVRMTRLLRPILLLQARAILTDQQANRPGLERAIAAVAAVARPPGRPANPDAGDDPLSRVSDFIVERLRLTAFLSDARATLPDAVTISPASLWETARAALTPQSLTLRHALRACLAAGLALALTMAWPVPYGYWFTITLVLTMQPFFALTFTRAVERIGGTVLGGLIAATLAPFTTTPIGMSLALFPLAVGALAVRAVNFGVFMALLTPMVVLLSELSRPNGSELLIALARAGFTLAGGLVALFLAWVLWPSWTPERLEGELSAAIRAHGAFASRTIALLIGESDARAVGDTRRAAGIATNALEVSLQRALLEPRRGAALRLQTALTIDAALRRMAGRLVALQLGGAQRDRHDKPAWRAWQAWIERVTAGGLAGLYAAPDRPPLPQNDPDAEALSRLAGQVEVIAGAAARLEQSPVDG